MADAPEPLQLEPGKRCSGCSQWKFLTEFNRHRRSPDGRQPMCRECHKAYHYLNWE